MKTKPPPSEHRNRPPQRPRKTSDFNRARVTLQEDNGRSSWRPFSIALITLSQDCRLWLARTKRCVIGWVAVGREGFRVSPPIPKGADQDPQLRSEEPCKKPR